MSRLAYLMVGLQQYPLWTKYFLSWNPIFGASTYGRYALTLTVQNTKFEQFQIIISQSSFQFCIFLINPSLLQINSSWMAVPWVEILGEEQLRNLLPLLFKWLMQETGLLVSMKIQGGPWELADFIYGQIKCSF